MSDESHHPVDGQELPQPAFTSMHLCGFLLCWFPANPFVLHYFSQFFREHFSVTIPNWLQYLQMLALTILGPFTAMVEGRNRDFCLQTALHALPVCLGAVVVATAIQILWRPRSVVGEVVRLIIWVSGWFVWFCGAMFSVFSNSG